MSEWSRRAIPVWLLLAIGVGPGCSMAPRGKLEDCHRQCQALQAESERLKDVVLNLRNQHKDMAQRAVDDARRVRELEEAARRYERSIMAYQDERDQLAAAFERLKAEVQPAAPP